MQYVQKEKKEQQQQQKKKYKIYNLQTIIIYMRCINNIFTFK